jgi:integrase
MPNLRLNKRSIEAIEPPAKGYALYWDTLLRGFGLRVTAKGVMSFVVSTVVGANGRPKRQRRTIGRYGPLSAEAARRKALQLLGEVSTGSDPWEQADETPTLADYVEREYLPDAQHRKKSWRDDRMIFHKHLLPALGKKRLSEITALDIVRLRKQWLSTDPRPANQTINLRLGTLRAALNKARREGFVEHNAFENVKAMPLDNQRVRYLDSDELLRFLRELHKLPEHDWLRRVLTLLLATAMRAGEAMSLRWEQVHPNRRQIHLYDAKAGSRIVHLPADLARAMQAWQETSRSEWVFPSHRDPSKPMYGKVHTPRWRKLLRDAGIRDFRVHDLRHTAATYARMAGADLSTVARMLGHKSLQMTQRYAHVTDPEVQAAVESVAAKLKG